MAKNRKHHKKLSSSWTNHSNRVVRHSCCGVVITIPAEIPQHRYMIDHAIGKRMFGGVIAGLTR